MKTLHGKFLLFILLPVIAGLIGLTSSSYFIARHYLFESMTRSGINYLKAEAERIRSFVIKERSVLEAIAQTHPLASYDDDRRQEIVDGVHEIVDDFVVTVFMNFSDDRIIRSTSTSLPADYDFKIRPWYTTAVALPPDQLQGVTEPYVDAGMNRLIMTHFRKILRDDGSWAGVIGIDLDIAEIAEVNNAFHEMSRPGIWFQMTDDSRIIVHPDVSKVDTYLDQSMEPLDIQIANAVKDKKNSSFQAIGRRSGKYWYMGFHHVEESRSNIVLMMPAEEILHPLKQLIRESILLFIVFITILAGVLIFVARRMSKPIYALTNAAECIVEKDEYQNELTIKSQDELGRLTQAFNLMMAGLRQRDFIRNTFGRYVTKEVVETLLDDPDGLRLGGEKKEVTVMFSDIRGFTPLSGQLEPDQVIDLLNRYLGTMSAIVTQYRGIISEFQGDSVLAFFGAPVEHGDSPSRAVACAVAMQRAMKNINADNTAMGLPQVAMGIGINTGKVIVGNIGSEKRAKYGVVGHEINLASRVEASTIGGQILITDATYRQVKENVISNTVLSKRFKGVVEEVLLHNVIGVTYPEKMLIPQFSHKTFPLPKPLDVQVTWMKGKQESEFSSQGNLTHFSNSYIRITIDHDLVPSTEIRINLDNEKENVKESIYGKVVASKRSENRFDHLLRISYISPEAKIGLGKS